MGRFDTFTIVEKFTKNKVFTSIIIFSIEFVNNKNHRVSIEGKSPYNEYHIVDSRRKIFPSNLMTFWATIWHA